MELLHLVDQRCLQKSHQLLPENGTEISSEEKSITFHKYIILGNEIMLQITQLVTWRETRTITFSDRCHGCCHDMPTMLVVAQNKEHTCTVS